MTSLSLFLLTFIVIFLLCLNLLVTDNDVISPNSIVCFMCLLSLGVAIFFINKVDFEVSIEAVMLIVLALFSFMLPGFVVPPKRRKITQEDIGDIDTYGRRIIIFSFVFIVVTTYLYYREVSKVASLSGFNNSSPMGMLYYYRTATLANTDAIETRSKVVGQMTIASYAISYLIIIDFVKRIIFKKIKDNKFLFIIELLSIFAVIVQSILSGGRTQFIYYIENLIFIILFYYNRKERISFRPSMIRKIIILIILVYVVFYFLGGLTGKTSKLDFSSTLFIYIGSPIPAFSQLVRGNVSFPNTSFGSDLLFGPIQFLNKLGMDIPINPSPAPAVSVGNLTTNIYGSFGRYFGTEGVVGLISFSFIMGIAYNIWYKRVKYRVSHIELSLVIYMIAAKALFDFCIEERFFMSVFSLGSILRIAYTFIFYYLFSGKFNGVRIIFKSNNQ